MLNQYATQADALHAELNTILNIVIACLFLLNLMVVWILFKNWRINNQMNKYLDNLDELPIKAQSKAHTSISDPLLKTTGFLGQNMIEFSGGDNSDDSKSELLDIFNDQSDIRQN